MDESYNIVKNKFRAYSEVKIIKMFSSEASKLFSENSLDWIYIDANHSYKECKNDLNIWFSKVNPCGIIGGHDYDSNFPEVIRAVNEFVLANKLTFMFPIRLNYWNSYFLRRRSHIRKNKI
jgi:hypothetical protein